MQRSIDIAVDVRSSRSSVEVSWLAPAECLPTRPDFSVHFASRCLQASAFAHCVRGIRHGPISSFLWSHAERRAGVRGAHARAALEQPLVRCEYPFLLALLVLILELQLRTSAHTGT